VKVCAAGLLWLAVVKVGHGAGDAAEAAASPPELSWYPAPGSKENGWGDKCFDPVTKSPVKDKIEVPKDAVDDKAIEVTIATAYDDKFSWTCSSVVAGDCSLQRQNKSECKRATAVVTSGDLKKSHSVTKDGKTYYYEGSELHVDAEHTWGDPAVAELQIQFATDDAKRLAFVVGFKKAASGTEHKFLKTLMDKTSTSTGTTTSSGTTTYTAGTVQAVVKKSDADAFKALDVGEILEKFIEVGKGEGVSYEGTETHPACRAQTLVVLEKLMEIPKAQVKELKLFMGVANGPSDWTDGNARKEKTQRLLAADAGTTPAAPVLKKVAVAKAKKGGNAAAAQSPKVAFVVAGSLLAVTAVAAM